MEKRERRAVPRLDAPSFLTAKIKVKHDKTNVVDVKVRDGNAGGLFLYMQTNGQEGSRLEVVLPVPQNEKDDELRWIRCQCRVVRVEEKGRDRHLGVGAVIEEYEPVEPADLPRA